MDKFQALEVFAAIVDHSGFAAAARHLRISPQAATRAIAGLEEHLGVPLLQRTTRSVRLTDEGAAFLARSRQVLADLRDAEHAAVGSRSEPHGLLAVTAPVVFGRIHVVPIITALLRRHTQLTVRLVLVDRVVQMVEEGLDVAVRIGNLADSALRGVGVGEVKQLLVASPAYLDSQGVPASSAELAQHRLILLTELTASDEWRFGADGRQAVQVRPVLTVNSADAAIAAAEAGLGIARVMSYQASAAIAAGRLRTVLDPEAPPAAAVTVLFHASHRDSPNVRAFVELAKDYFRDRAL